VHILAVSGGNIAMLVSFLMLILFWLPYYARIGVISMMVIVYGMICGGDSSVVRAVIMASIGII
jgi:predicted membrane metal-binding protein